MNTLNHFTNQKGVSLLITLVLLSVTTIIALDLYLISHRTIQRTVNSKITGSAKYALDSGVSMGLHAAGISGAGRETSLRYDCHSYDESLSSSGAGAAPLSWAPCNEIKSEYFVTARAVDIDPSTANDRFIVPPPGEGSAGEYCTRLNNFANLNHNVNQNILKPCNWNKLYYGESVAIPLYVTNAPNPPLNPSGVINPVDLPDGTGPGLGSFTIKVRTPCDVIQYDASGKNLAGSIASGDEDDWCVDAVNADDTDIDARDELWDFDPSFNAKDIIVHWSIVGNCDYEPDDSNDGSCVGIAVSSSQTNTSNFSDINKDAINDAKDNSFGMQYAVVGSEATFDTGPRNRIDDLNTSSNPTILNYLTNATPTATLPTVDQPILYMSVVSPMTTGYDAFADAPTTVPYIEYQIETDQPISDSNFTVHATGWYGTYRQSKKAKKVFLHAQPNFVFQN